MTAGPIDLNRRYTVEEYLALNEASQEKYEYHNGQIVHLSALIGMAGGLGAHSTVKTNLIGATWARLRGHCCQCFDSGMQVLISGTGMYVYPDISVVCDDPQYTEPAKQKQLLNPQVVVEVLSAGTEGNDRGPKFEKFLRLPSLKEYVLVSSTDYRIESFLRQADGTWSFAYFVGKESMFRFRSIPLDVPMSEIYDRLTFDAPPEDREERS